MIDSLKIVSKEKDLSNERQFRAMTTLKVDRGERTLDYYGTLANLTENGTHHMDIPTSIPLCRLMEIPSPPLQTVT